jgi:protein-S-isoprenylcysteine O-methyltransferase Ste14
MLPPALQQDCQRVTRTQYMIQAMRTIALFLILAGWTGWVIPFFLVKKSGPPQQLDRRARWGIVLQGIGFVLIWQIRWRAPVGPIRLVISALFFVIAITISWTAARTLGRQWRFDAGLNADHQLVRAGAYRYLRHPIYASMLCLQLATGALLTPLWLLVTGLAFSVIGTEIRVHIEDALLEARFGKEFHSYQQTVPAYLPFIR